jgi:hypothetical protein
VVRINGSLLPGDSGAPLIDWRGQVAGIGDGGLERGTVGLGWATQPQYVNQLRNSDEPLTVASIGAAAVDFAVTIPKTQADAADSTVKCGALSLVRSRHVRLGELVETTDDPVKLGKLVQDLIGTPIDQFENDEFTIWIEPKSGAGIALPKELHIESGADHCVVHTAAADIDYIIALEPLPFDAGTAEWELEANRQAWLAGYRAIAAANAVQFVSDRKHSAPRRFENGGIIARRMGTGKSRDGTAVRFFTNDLSGRGAFVSISVINRAVKTDAAAMTDTEKLAWARGLLAVNLTALPPVQEAAATGPEATGVSDASDMVWPGPRSYPRVRCGEAGLIPLSQPRTLADLRDSADLDRVVQPLAGITSAQIEQDRFEVWVQPLKGAVVLLPHGLKLAADQQTCRIASPTKIGFALRVTTAESPRQAKAATQVFVRELVQAAGARLRPDRTARFEAKIAPIGLVEGHLRIGTRPDGGRAMFYLVTLKREQVLTLFAMTDFDARAPDALAPADRAALAQGLAAVRLSTLLPPTGFLTPQPTASSPSTTPAPTASH